MATISLYVSGQTELSDVNEFFKKNLMNAGENPIAFFDGVFYESHQERVGNIVFQDYLVFTDKAVYLWARGANKDYLDRFNLGTVSVNSRNKDSDFATLNLKIKRDEKEPVYVIFDMVEIREAELITRLHTIIETTIEDALGVNYRKEIPDDIAARIHQQSRSVCPPQPLTIVMNQPPISARQDSNIGYGQDLLEQYKASIGYDTEGQQSTSQDYSSSTGASGRRPSASGPAGNPVADSMGGLENMLPTDPAALKRIASSIKDMVGDAPFKLRDQVMKDLQHVPGDMATVLTALNELVSNIAGNPQAEKFVMSALTTAVRNDGVLGSISKILKLTTNFGGGGRKSQQKQSLRENRQEGADGSSRRRNAASFDEDGDDSSTIRRKKIRIKDDSVVPDPFSTPSFRSRPNEESKPVPRKDSTAQGAFDDDSEPEIRRKKISIKADAADMPILVRDMMVMDKLPENLSHENPVKDVDVREIQRKKIRIVADEDATHSVTADEPVLKNTLFFDDPIHTSDEIEVRRKKISVITESDDEKISISGDILVDALEAVADSDDGDLPKVVLEPDVMSSASPADTESSIREVNTSGSSESIQSGESNPDDQSLKRTIKIKSTQ
ncbi:MAG: hypothetical protein JZU65_10540 [Chlorobium sp.]|jgi:hypothetical protein|nr:hypothetical protein [Chlorobium sp.]